MSMRRHDWSYPRATRIGALRDARKAPARVVVGKVLALRANTSMCELQTKARRSMEERSMRKSTACGDHSAHEDLA
eukprot:1579609-Pleurochrysis_carterae.AAC.1